jgi:hypothetical protein
VVALACLHATATALDSTAPAFADTYYGGYPRNGFDPILTVVVARSGVRLTTEAAGDGETAPAEQGHTAHVTLERTRALQPLMETAKRLHQATTAIPLLDGQSRPFGHTPALLRLSFHADSEGLPFFHLELAGASYPANFHSRTPDDLVAVEAWRFHVLAHGAAWEQDAVIARWSIEDEKGNVDAPDSAQARLVFAARSASRTRASEILFKPRQVPLWRCDDGVESERLVRGLFAATPP